eukprot:745983-Rhodomonas_salina.1
MQCAVLACLPLPPSYATRISGTDLPITATFLCHARYQHSRYQPEDARLPLASPLLHRPPPPPLLQPSQTHVSPPPNPRFFRLNPPKLPFFLHPAPQYPHESPTTARPFSVPEETLPSDDQSSPHLKGIFALYDTSGQCCDTEC